MNSVQRFFRRYILSMIGIIFLFLGINIALFFAVMIIGSMSGSGTSLSVRDLSNGVVWQDGAWTADSAALSILRKNDAWAMLLDENGNLPDIQKPFLVDAIGTCVGACTGNTVVTTFVESSAGVEAGGRTGFASVITAVIFGLMVFLSPLVLMIPNAATGPALIFVGFLMIQGIQNIDFSDFTEAFGPFVMIMFTIFTGSIAGGISAGIIAHGAIKLLTGRWKDVHPFLYVLCIPLILYFLS